eukprot:230540-Prymnesium_polylepis.1
MGPCSANWNRSGSSGLPLSEGFSIAMSEPARCAARSRTHSRLVISLALWSSRRCCLGTSGRPRICLRLRTGGGAD